MLGGNNMRLRSNHRWWELVPNGITVRFRAILDVPNGITMKCKKVFICMFHFTFKRSRIKYFINKITIIGDTDLTA